MEHVAPLEAGEFSSDEEAVAASPGARASNISRSGATARRNYLVKTIS